MAQWKLGVAGRSELGSTTILGRGQELAGTVFVNANIIPAGPPRVYEFELTPTVWTDADTFGSATVALSASLRATQVVGYAEIDIADQPLRATQVVGYAEIDIADQPLNLTSVLGMAEVTIPDAPLNLTSVLGMAEVTLPEFPLRFTSVLGMAELDILGPWEATGDFVWMMH